MAKFPDTITNIFAHHILAIIFSEKK